MNVSANITDSWSDALCISKAPLIIALAFMVCLSLINYVASILPTGLEEKPRFIEILTLQMQIWKEVASTAASDFCCWAVKFPE